MKPSSRRSLVAMAVALGALSGCHACGRGAPPVGDHDAGQGSRGAIAVSGVAASVVPPRQASSTSTGVEAGAPARPGMAWIPPGTLRAGTPPEHTPRVADEEMAGVPVEMSGFYVDLLPWPNEPNAIPTSNVTRDEAEQLCVAKGKRLCSELEWERACKGPESTLYEYGDGYRKDVCGTGVAPEQAARRPTGEHAQCKSGFGVSEMHGGVFEWTSSAWGRGSRDASLGVLRGGNSPAGEIVGRCANAIARAPTKKAATMGLRCCAGPKSPAEVHLELQGTPGFAMARTPPETSSWIPAIASAAGAPPSIDPKSVHAWTWTPVANEELVVAIGCSTPPRTCGLVVGRDATGASSGDAASVNVLTSAPTGRDLPEVARVGDARHLRMRSLDAQGVFGRDITYVYGRVDLGAPKRR